jgi:hypothetical protein
LSIFFPAASASFAISNSLAAVAVAYPERSMRDAVRSWIVVTWSRNQSAVSEWHCMQAFKSFFRGLVTRWSETL